MTSEEEARAGAGPRRARVVVLVSGSGTLLQALLDAAVAPDYPALVVAVGADRAATLGEQRARAAGIPTFVCAVADHPSRADWDAALAAKVAAYAPDLVVSAGFMKLLGPVMLATHQVVNTHPALLPSFPGAHGVRDALAHGVKVTGATVHWVDAGVDTGPIIAQRALPVEEGESEADLHERIKTIERELLVDVVARLSDRPGSRASAAP